MTRKIKKIQGGRDNIWRAAVIVISAEFFAFAIIALIIISG